MQCLEPLLGATIDWCHYASNYPGSVLGFQLLFKRQLQLIYYPQKHYKNHIFNCVSNKKGNFSPIKILNKLSAYEYIDFSREKLNISSGSWLLCYCPFVCYHQYLIKLVDFLDLEYSFLSYLFIWHIQHSESVIDLLNNSLENSSQTILLVTYYLYRQSHLFQNSILNYYV